MKVHVLLCCLVVVSNAFEFIPSGQSLSFLNLNVPQSSCDKADTWPIPKLNFNYEAIENYVKDIVNCRPDYIGAVSVSTVQLDETDRVTNGLEFAFGKLNQSDPSSGVPVPGTRFCVGSITKDMTAQVVGVVLESKNLTYDVLLKDIIPEFYQFYFGDPAAAKLTMRDLLAHKHAIPSHDVPNAFGMETPREQVWRNLKYLAPMENLPANWRNVFQYNNWIYSLAGYAASLVYDPTGNTTWEDLVTKFIFKPLDMKFATFLHYKHNWSGFAVASVKNVNQPGWSPADLQLAQLFGNQVAPAGSVCLSAEDMSKWLAHLLRTGESPTGAPSRKIVHQTFMASNHHLFTDPSDFVLQDPDFMFEEYTYGFGMGTGVYKGTRKLSHGGIITGYVSNLMILPDYKTGIWVSTTNDPYYFQGIAEPISYGIWDILTNKTISHPWSTDTICNMTLPPLTSNIINLVNCTVDYDPNYDSILGTFFHGTFGNISVQYNYDTHQIRWYFGVEGTASLCSPTVIKEGLLFAIRIDSNSSVAAVNYDQLMFAPFVTFIWSVPNYVGLVMNFFEPRANPPPIFFRPLAPDTTTKVPETSTPSRATEMSSVFPFSSVDQSTLVSDTTNDARSTALLPDTSSDSSTNELSSISVISSGQQSTSLPDTTTTANTVAIDSSTALPTITDSANVSSTEPSSTTILSTTTTNGANINQMASVQLAFAWLLLILTLYSRFVPA